MAVFRIAVVMIIVLAPSTEGWAGTLLRRGSRGTDWCQLGIRVLEKFHQCVADARGYPTSSGDLIPWDEIDSWDDISDALHTFCRDVVPASRTCFAASISTCDHAAQEHLNQLAEDTNIGCEAGGTQPNQAVLYIVSELKKRGNKPEDTCEDSVQPWRCSDDTLEKIQFDEEEFNAMDVDDAVALAQQYMDLTVECMVSKYRQHADICPNWRENAAKTIIGLFFTTQLGTTFAFNEGKIAEMFQVCTYSSFNFNPVTSEGAGFSSGTRFPRKSCARKRPHSVVKGR